MLPRIRISRGPVPRFGTAIAAVFGCVLVVLSRPASAALPTDLTALHHDGQTFLTWRIPQVGPGWTFRVYESAAPIQTSADLAGATLTATVGDSSWFDRRLSAIQNQPYGYCIVPGGAPLGASQGLFVATPATDRSRYYAVTAQLGAEPEDLGIRAGANSLQVPVAEHPAPPLPVFQRTLFLGGTVANVYTLWTTDQATPHVAAMGNRPGLAFDCAVTNGNTGTLWVAMHHAGGSFLSAIFTPGASGDRVLGLDDFVHNERTWWYGYHENYDESTLALPPPTSGTVRDYTYQRVLYTTLWARRTFPVDTTRVYSAGASMGAIGATMLAMRRPDLIAGVLCVVGKVDFSFVTDPASEALFNPNGVLRFFTDRLWGTVATNLPASGGMSVYQSVNGGHRAHLWERDGLPPFVMVNGRNDVTVGWAENIGFYDSMRVSRHGGYFFWDSRGHADGFQAWQPMQDPAYLARFRTNRSYPALANCTADDDPGNGSVATGDSVGCINGFVEWDTTLVDQPGAWETTLKLRNLTTLTGTIPSPDSTRVDVTPRRLQQFHVNAGGSYAYEVRAVSNNSLLGSGNVVADALGLVTIPQVRVPHTGSRVHITPLAGAAEPNAGSGAAAARRRERAP